MTKNKAILLILVISCLLFTACKSNDNKDNNNKNDNSTSLSQQDKENLEKEQLEQQRKDAENKVYLLLGSREPNANEQVFVSTEDGKIAQIGGSHTAILKLEDVKKMYPDVELTDSLNNLVFDGIRIYNSENPSYKLLDKLPEGKELNKIYTLELKPENIEKGSIYYSDKGSVTIIEFDKKIDKLKLKEVEKIEDTYTLYTDDLGGYHLIWANDNFEFSIQSDKDTLKLLAEDKLAEKIVV